MLTSISIKNFKVFDDVTIELGDRVVFVGPNNSGKTTALQALALWKIGVAKWIEKRGYGKTTKKRTGVTINRRDIIGLPIPTTNLLWKNRHVRKGIKKNGKTLTENILVEITVESLSWKCGLEFDYANEESIYCRPIKINDKERLPVPKEAGEINIAYLPPMSGLTSNETRLDPGAIAVRLGEGRTAEVLRNLCFKVHTESPQLWEEIVAYMYNLFGVNLIEPEYIPERGEIIMNYKTPDGTLLDLSASGRGQQQTLLLLTYMAANPGSILLLDEPDAHLEILRQRQIYQMISEISDKTNSQIIAASHSEVILNEAADKDILVAFVGKPHRIDDRGSQVVKSLKEIGFEHYMLAEEKGWVLYLEGSTDLAILLAFAKKLDHPAYKLLEDPFVKYVANQPQKAKEHFYGLKEAKQDLRAIAIYDHLDKDLFSDPNIFQHMWQKREIENYLCFRNVLLDYAYEEGRKLQGELFGTQWKEIMEETILEIETALQSLNKPSPWSDDIKVTDDFLDPLFKNFFQKLNMQNLMQKTDYHKLAKYIQKDQISEEIMYVLNKIEEIGLHKS